MSTDTSPPGPTPTDPGLPPVSPPSGKAFLQLIAVPFLIVVGVVLVIMFFTGWAAQLVGLAVGNDSQTYLRRLDDDNAEVRWRAASDLAQTLLRDDNLASDPDFALELAARLEKARADSARAEADAAERLPSLSKKEAARVRKELEARRNLLMFLTACLGNVVVPAGVPQLKEVALQTKGIEWQELAERRRRALWALANLGENLKRYDALPDERKDFIAARLGHAIETNKHPEWARPTLEYLTKRRDGKADTLGVADVLVECAADQEFYAVREMAALAMNFWHGTAEEDARVEEALARLATDNGAGQERLDELRDQFLEDNPDRTRARVKDAGFEIRANANIALARRGSPLTRLDLLARMLDPEALRGIFVLVHDDGREEADEAAVVQTVIHTLKAVEVYHQRRPDRDLGAVRQAVRILGEDGNATIRARAKRVGLALDD